MFVQEKKKKKNVSGFSLPGREDQASVGLFILVCNIVDVPIAALYHVYRL